MAPSKSIFISYGTADSEPVARWLRDELDKRGYDVWWDRDRLPSMTGAEWERAIESAIRERDVVIALLSPSAVRPNGECRHEISLARDLDRMIIPVMVKRCDRPLRIHALQYIDFEGFDRAPEDRRVALLDSVVAAIDRGLPEDPGIVELRRRLPRLDFEWAYARHSHFFGRQWLFDRLDAWVESGNEPLMFIMGPPGVGKTALMARWVQTRMRIGAVHFCRHDRSDLRNPVLMVGSIASQLLALDQHLPGFAEAIRQVDISQAVAGGGLERATELMDRMILDPLRRLEGGRPWVLAIDAIDEAGPDIVAMLAKVQRHIPRSVRLLITARPESDLVARFPNRFMLDAMGSENARDLREMCRLRAREVPIPTDERVGEWSQVIPGSPMVLNWVAALNLGPDVIARGFDDQLTYEERETVKLRFGILHGRHLESHTYTREEVGRIFKRSCEEVQATEDRALEKYREFLHLSRAERTGDQVASASAGIFLVASTLLGELQSGRMAPADLRKPATGLDGMYDDQVERRLPAWEGVDPVLRCLEVLVVWGDPIGDEDIAEVLDCPVREVRAALNRLGTLLEVRDGVRSPLHRTFFEWLTSADRSGHPMSVSEVDGLSSIARWANRTNKPEAWLRLGKCSIRLGRLEHARAALEQGLRSDDVVAGRAAQQQLRLLASLMDVHRRTGSADQAIECAERWLGLESRVGDIDARTRAFERIRIADLLHARGHSDRADALYSEAMDLGQRGAGADAFLEAACPLMWRRMSSGDRGGARQLAARLVRGLRRDPVARDQLVEALRSIRDLHAELGESKAALRIGRQVVGIGDRLGLDSVEPYDLLFLARHDHDEMWWLARAISRFDQGGGICCDLELEARLRLVDATGPGMRRAQLLKLVKLLEVQAGTPSAIDGEAWHRIGQHWMELGELHLAEAALLRALDISRAEEPDGGSVRIACLTDLADNAARGGRLEMADQWHREQVSELSRAGNARWLAEALFAYSRFLIDTGRPKEALPVLRQGMEVDRGRIECGDHAALRAAEVHWQLHLLKACELAGEKADGDSIAQELAKRSVASVPDGRESRKVCATILRALIDWGQFMGRADDVSRWREQLASVSAEEPES